MLNTNLFLAFSHFYYSILGNIIYLNVSNHTTTSNNSLTQTWLYIQENQQINDTFILNLDQGTHIIQSPFPFLMALSQGVSILHSGEDSKALPLIFFNCSYTYSNCSTFSLSLFNQVHFHNISFKNLNTIMESTQIEFLNCTFSGIIYLLVSSCSIVMDTFISNGEFQINITGSSFIFNKWNQVEGSVLMNISDNSNVLLSSSNFNGVKFYSNFIYGMASQLAFTNVTFTDCISWKVFLKLRDGMEAYFVNVLLKGNCIWHILNLKNGGFFKILNYTERDTILLERKNADSYYHYLVEQSTMEMSQVKLESFTLSQTNIDVSNGGYIIINKLFMYNISVIPVEYDIKLFFVEGEGFLNLTQAHIKDCDIDTPSHDTTIYYFLISTGNLFGEDILFERQNGKLEGRLNKYVDIAFCIYLNSAATLRNITVDSTYVDSIYCVWATIDISYFTIKNLIMVGAEYPSVMVTYCSCIRYDNFFFENITMLNSRILIVINDQQLTISNFTFSDVTCPGDFYIELISFRGSLVNIENFTLNDISAPSLPLFLLITSIMYIKNSKFSDIIVNNFISIFTPDSFFEISNTSFNMLSFGQTWEISDRCSIQNCHFYNISANGSPSLELSPRINMAELKNCTFYYFLNGTLLLNPQQGSLAIIENCLFFENVANRGSAIVIGSNVNTSYLVVDCIFINNTALLYGGTLASTNMTIEFCSGMDANSHLSFQSGNQLPGFSIALLDWFWYKVLPSTLEDGLLVYLEVHNASQLKSLDANIVNEIEQFVQPGNGIVTFDASIVVGKPGDYELWAIPSLRFKSLILKVPFTILECVSPYISIMVDNEPFPQCQLPLCHGTCHEPNGVCVGMDICQCFNNYEGVTCERIKGWNVSFFFEDSSLNKITLFYKNSSESILQNLFNISYSLEPSTLSRIILVSLQLNSSNQSNSSLVAIFRIEPASSALTLGQENYILESCEEFLKAQLIIPSSFEAPTVSLLQVPPIFPNIINPFFIFGFCAVIISLLIMIVFLEKLKNWRDFKDPEITLLWTTYAGMVGVIVHFLLSYHQPTTTICILKNLISWWIPIQPLSLVFVMGTLAFQYGECIELAERSFSNINWMVVSFIGFVIQQITLYASLPVILPSIVYGDTKFWSCSTVEKNNMFLLVVLYNLSLLVFTAIFLFFFNFNHSKWIFFRNIIPFLFAIISTQFLEFFSFINPVVWFNVLFPVRIISFLGISIVFYLKHVRYEARESMECLAQSTFEEPKTHLFSNTIQDTTSHSKTCQVFCCRSCVFPFWRRRILRIDRRKTYCLFLESDDSETSTTFCNIQTITKIEDNYVELTASDGRKWFLRSAESITLQDISNFLLSSVMNQT